MFTFPKTIEKGFTLIELLVVIVIIGILATLTTITVTGVRANARDARRISDLKQIASALELYQADNNSYPTYITGGNSLVNPNDSSKVYMKKIPSDPSANTSYAYYGSSSRFTLRTTIEKSVDNIPVGPVIITNNGNVRQASNVDSRHLDTDLNFSGSLIGHWALDGNTGGTKLVGSGNLATASGGVTTAIGRFGEADGAYLFDGSTGRVDVAGTLDVIGNGDRDFTVSNWTYYNSPGMDPAWAGSLLLGNAYQDGLLVAGSRVLIGDASFSSLSISSASPNQWNHVVITYDYANKRLRSYINGVAKNTATHTNPITNVDKKVYIGIRSNSGSNYFNGSITDTRIYNKTLTADEVSQLYNATRP